MWLFYTIKCQDNLRVFFYFDETFELMPTFKSFTDLRFIQFQSPIFKLGTILLLQLKPTYA